MLSIEKVRTDLPPCEKRILIVSTVAVAESTDIALSIGNVTETAPGARVKLTRVVLAAGRGLLVEYVAFVPKPV